MNEWIEKGHQALGFLALAIAAHLPRNDLAKLSDISPTMSTASIEEQRAKVIRELMIAGDVTCLVPDPEPLVWVYCTVGNVQLKAVYGIWPERQASWRGKIAALPSPLKAFQGEF